MKAVPENSKPYEIVREIGEIKQGAIQTMSLNQVLWNGKGDPCYDLRWWKKEDGDLTAFRGGIVLTKNEARKLRDLLIAENLGEEDKNAVR